MGASGGSGASSDIVYGNQIVAYYEVTEDGNYTICNQGISGMPIAIYVNDVEIAHSRIEVTAHLSSGINKVTYVFTPICVSLQEFLLCPDCRFITTLDFTNFDSKIVESWDGFLYAYSYESSRLKEIIGIIDLSGAYQAHRIFGMGTDLSFPFLTKIDGIINFGKHRNLTKAFISADLYNPHPFLWKEIMVKGAFDRRSAGYDDVNIGFFEDSSFATDEELSIVRAKGYTWDYD